MNTSFGYILELRRNGGLVAICLIEELAGEQHILAAVQLPDAKLVAMQLGLDDIAESAINLELLPTIALNLPFNKP